MRKLQIWCPVVPKTNVAQKWTKLGNSHAAGPKCWVNSTSLHAVHLLGSRLVRVRYLPILPLQFWVVLGGKWPLNKTIFKYSFLCVSRRHGFTWPTLVKIGSWEGAEKSSRFVDKKNLRLRRTRPSPNFAPLNRSRPKFLEHRCYSFTCACIRNLVRIGWGLPNNPEWLIFGPHSAYNISFKA